MKFESGIEIGSLNRQRGQSPQRFQRLRIGFEHLLVEPLGMLALAHAAVSQRQIGVGFRPLPDDTSGSLRTLPRRRDNPAAAGAGSPGGSALPLRSGPSPAHLAIVALGFLGAGRSARAAAPYSRWGPALRGWPPRHSRRPHARRPYRRVVRARCPGWYSLRRLGPASSGLPHKLRRPVPSGRISGAPAPG